MWNEMRHIDIKINIEIDFVIDINIISLLKYFVNNIHMRNLNVIMKIKKLLKTFRVTPLDTCTKN